MASHEAAGADLTRKRRTVKKSVSFQAHASCNVESEKENSGIPNNFKSIFLIQPHLPFLLYTLFKSGLTVDPYKSMVKGLIGLLIMQLMYGLLITSYYKKRGEDKKTKAKKRDGMNLFWLVVSSTLVSIAVANVMFIAFILFGAPLNGFLKETYLLACHLSIIVFAPLLTLYRLDFQSLRNIFTNEHFYRIIFNDQVLCASSAAIIGAWIGVVPIPLDWDRPWQQWPITILSGGYIGAFVGSIFALLLQ